MVSPSETLQLSASALDLGEPDGEEPSMHPSWHIPAIEAAFAAAAKDGSSWHTALEYLAAATESARAILLPLNQGNAPIIGLSESLGFRSEVDCLQGWVQCHLDHRRISELSLTGVIANFDCRTPEQCGSRCHELFECQALPWFAGVKVTANQDLWCLVIQRSIQQRPFSGAELSKLNNISSALSRVAAEARALGLARAEGALSAFEAINLPAVLIDKHGQLLQLNQASKQCVGDDVAMSGGRIASFTRDARVALKEALNSIMLSSGRSMLIVPLPRRGDRPALLGQVIRFSSASQAVFAPCHAIVTFIDVDARPVPVEGILGRYFGLTPAEARLARGLATGKNLDVLAKELKITKQTARQELKSVFAKLDTHRQAELVAALGALPTA